MREALIQFLGVVLLLVPLAAVRWHLAGRLRRAPTLLAPVDMGSRWRLEIYSVQDDVDAVLADPVDVPFPVKRVRSIKVEQPSVRPELVWTLPRVELDVEIDDPFTDAALSGLLGVGYRVRFVTGNEAVIDTRLRRLRLRRVPFG